jgi:acylphosphatase
MKRVRLIVTGDVQGVGFRYHAQKEAERLALTGWERNEPNGDVYIVVEGEDEKVDKFVKWAKSGSPLAEVENIDISEEKYTGEEPPFEVR